MSEKVQEEFFERIAARYDRRFCRSRWPRNQQLKAAQVAKVLGDVVREGPVIEIGCGTGQHAGELLTAYPGLRYVGSDLSAAMLDIARQRLAPFGDRVTLRVAKQNSVPACDGAYAGAFGVDVLHHVENPPQLLRHLRLTLRPGAPVVFLEGNPYFPVTTFIGLAQKEERGLFKMRPKILGPWFRGAGFEHVKVSLGPVYTPPGPERFFGALDWIDRTLAKTPVIRNLAIYFTAQGRAPES